MPQLEDIRATWDSEAGWSSAGDEWSGAWGGTGQLWHGTLLPRIRSFVPARTILELGPGQGRWTQYLKDLAEEMVLVDVAQHSIDSCRKRFAGSSHIAYHVGDGKSLPTVADGAVDFAFSFDSLVHAEADVLEAYARELGRTLSPDGVAFLHISNMATYRRAAALARRVPDRLRRRLVMRGLLVNTYAWRAESAQAELFAAQCEDAGLKCVGIELITWEYGRQLTDALLLIARPGSRWDRERVTVRNTRFMQEAHALARVAPIYAETSWAASRSRST